MKVVFIILLFPSVACAFLKGIPYKKTEICEKIKADYDQADIGWYQAVADWSNFVKVQTDMAKAQNNNSRAEVDMSKTLANIKKYCVSKAKVGLKPKRKLRA